MLASPEVQQVNAFLQLVPLFVIEFQASLR